METRMTDPKPSAEEWNTDPEVRESFWVLDPDGWRDPSDPCDWYMDKISFAEFQRRAIPSTCCFSNKWLAAAMAEKENQK
jgi:hypothetical protein